MTLEPGTKVKLTLPEVIFVDFTDDRDHMHAHESVSHCRPSALVGRYVLESTVIPNDRKDVGQA